MRVLFMGTPDFAVPSLESIINAGHEVVGVFTQPDKPRGRKQELTPPEVKVCALKHGIKVFQPVKMKDGAALSIIKELSPDVIVVVAYGRILPKDIIDFPKYGCINVHGSLLPKYRGAAPIQWSVINGDKETGITTMQMNEGLDTGDILLVEKLPVLIDDTAASVFDKLSEIGAKLIVETLNYAQDGKLKPIKQDEALSSYAPMLDKSMCEIDWTKPANVVHNLVRGLYDWPIAHTKLNGKKLKIYKTRLSSLCGKPGEVVALSPLTIACGEGAVEVLELQLEGKKRMDSDSFLIGHKIAVGTVL